MKFKNKLLALSIAALAFGASFTHKICVEATPKSTNNNSTTKTTDEGNEQKTEAINSTTKNNEESNKKNDEGKKTQPTDNKEAETEINSIAENDEEKTTNLNINEIIEPKEAETEHKTNETNKPEILKYKSSPNINILNDVIFKNNNYFLMSEKYENKIEQIFNSIINYENSNKKMKIVFECIDILRKKFKILSQTALLKKTLIYLAKKSNNNSIITKHLEIYKEIVNEQIKPTIEFLHNLEKIPLGMIMGIYKGRFLFLKVYYKEILFALEKIRSKKYEFFMNDKDFKTYLSYLYDNNIINRIFMTADSHTQNIIINYFNNYFHIDHKEKDDFQCKIEDLEAEAKKLIETTEKDIHKFKQILEADKEDLKNLGIKSEKEPNQNTTDTTPLTFKLNIPKPESPNTAQSKTTNESECNKQELEKYHTLSNLLSTLLDEAYSQKPQNKEYINALENYINSIKEGKMQKEVQIELLEEHIKNSPLNKITTKKTVNTCIEERKKIEEINKEIKEQKLKPEDEKELKKLIEDFNNIIKTIEEKEIELIEFKGKTIDYDRLAKELEENTTSSTGILESNLLLELEKLKKEGKDTTDLAKLLLENLEKQGELIKDFDSLKMQLMILQRTVTANEKIMETKIRQDKTKEKEIEEKLDKLKEKTLEKADVIKYINDLEYKIAYKEQSIKKLKSNLEKLKLIKNPTSIQKKNMELSESTIKRCNNELVDLKNKLENIKK